MSSVATGRVWDSCGSSELAGAEPVFWMALVKYPGFCSYMGARAGVGWLAGCEVPVRAASYSAGGT